MAAKCTVKFRRDGAGPSAILMWQGHSLNYLAYPRGHRVTVSEARRAKQQLMRGCAELVKGYQKRARRQRRGR